MRVTEGTKISSSKINATTVFSFWPEVLPDSTQYAALKDQGCLINSDLGGIFEAQAPLSKEQRKKYLDQGSRLADMTFDPDLVYTFDYYQHFFSPASCSFNLGGISSVGLANYIGPQPILLSMAKLAGTNEYLW